jgi:2-(1,2-epoxy-1,2-dihydrophenyl)acetyl-CoA isomerase
MTYEHITYERRGRVGLVTLNRPERLNAWTRTMYSEAHDAVEQAANDAAVGAVVFTGAGRAYCSGADVGGWQQQLESTGDRRGSGVVEGDDTWIHFLQRQEKPVIAAINGAAVGVGVTHTLPMDIRIASDQARFGMAFIKMGLSPEVASSFYLSQMVGTARALEWCLTGRLVGAEEAREAGLISEVVAADRLMERAFELAEQLAAHPPGAVKRIRKLFASNAVDGNIESVLSKEAGALAEARRSPAHREAVNAFLEKRKPDFSNL